MVSPHARALSRAASMPTRSIPWQSMSLILVQSEFDTVGTLHRSLKDAKHLTAATLDVPDSSQVSRLPYRCILHI